MRKLVLVLALLPTAMAVSGCKRGHSKNPVRAATEAVKDKDLQATRQSECDDKSMDSIPGGGLAEAAGEITGLAKSSRMLYTFAGNNVTRSLVLYVQPGCTQEALTFYERGVFKIETKQATNDGGRILDLDFRTLNVSVKDGSVIEAINKLSFCGNSNWAADGKEREVTKAAKDKTCYNAEVPRKIPTTYRIDSGTLYFGTKAAKPGERPSTMNFGSKFTVK